MNKVGQVDGAVVVVAVIAMVDRLVLDGPELGAGRWRSAGLLEVDGEDERATRRLAEDDVVVRVGVEENGLTAGRVEAAVVAVERGAVGVGQGDVAQRSGRVERDDVAGALRGADCAVGPKLRAVAESRRRPAIVEKRTSSSSASPAGSRGRHAVLQSGGLVVRNRCSGRCNELFCHGSVLTVGRRPSRRPIEVALGQPL